MQAVNMTIMDTAPIYGWHPEIIMVRYMSILQFITMADSQETKLPLSISATATSTTTLPLLTAMDIIMPFDNTLPLTTRNSAHLTDSS